MNAPSTAGAMVALLALGCIDTPDPCESSYSSSEVTSQSLSESDVLSAAGDALEIPFRITLNGLPETWKEWPILSAELGVQVTERYTTGEPGGDGLTEMPRIVSLFDDQTPEVPRSSPYTSFPGPNPQAQGAPIFSSCEFDPDGACCNWNTTSCSVAGTLFVMRIDGAPFPPVDVSIETSAHARLKLCQPPQKTPHKPELELTRVTP